MQTEDEVAVLDVVEAENRTFWMRDADAYLKLHLRSPDTMLWGFKQGGGFVIRKGWDEIVARSLDHMRRFPEPVPELAEAPMSNLTMRVAAGMAWVRYDRMYPLLPANDGRGPNGVLHNLRILEKHGERWLVAAKGLLDANLGEEVVLRVGSGGAILWQSAAAVRQMREDEHFVVRGGSIRGRSRKLDARLRDAVEWAIASDRDVMPRGGSVPLHFETYSGLPRIVWVVADLSGALVFLDDVRPLAERMAIAAHAFALSPAQTRLATAIAEGGEPAAYARAAGISANTVRTHLKRMFEKVGVSSQAGLVRALLTLSPPR